MAFWPGDYDDSNCWYPRKGRLLLGPIPSRSNTFNPFKWWPRSKTFNPFKWWPQ